MPRRRSTVDVTATAPDGVARTMRARVVGDMALLARRTWTLTVRACPGHLLTWTVPHGLRLGVETRQRKAR